MLRAVSGSAEQFGPELTAEGLTVEASVEPLRARAEDMEDVTK